MYRVQLLFPINRLNWISHGMQRSDKRKITVLIQLIEELQRIDETKNSVEWR